MDAVPEGRILGMIVIDLEQRSRANELNLLGSRRARGPLKPESTEGRPWGQPLKKAEGAPLNLG